MNNTYSDKQALVQSSVSAIENNMDKLVIHALRILRDDDFRKHALDSLPFEELLYSPMRLNEPGCPVTRIGIHLIKMSNEPSRYSFGFSLNFKDAELQDENFICHVTTCKTLDNLCEWVKLPRFKDTVLLKSKRIIENRYGNFIPSL